MVDRVLIESVKLTNASVERVECIIKCILILVDDHYVIYFGFQKWSSLSAAFPEIAHLLSSSFAYFLRIVVEFQLCLFCVYLPF